MTTAQPAPLVTPSLSSLKMEERKRSLAVETEDLAAPRKRLVKDEHGQAMRMDAEKEKEIEYFQKDAILRQMKEYKRQQRIAEEQYTQLRDQCKHHDDHLRTIDAWFAQLLDEVRVIAGQSLPTPPPSATSTTEYYGSALVFENNELFSQHLQARSANIKAAISDLFGRLPSVSPELDDLRKQMNEALAKEKELVVEHRRALDEQHSLERRLEDATTRYIKAEKSLDRAKSSQVQKLERQALGNGDSASPSTSKKGSLPLKKEQYEANGELENGLGSAEAEAARREAMAVAERQRQQVEEIEAENDRLTNELSAARTKLVSLSDDDYAETSLFKTFKAKFEDVTSRVNDLDATNAKLREEAQKYHAERTSYRRQLDDDLRDSITESETQIARAETDLARIRNNRDELMAELQMRKDHDDKRSTLADDAKKLAEARDAKIAALESELERLKLEFGHSAPPQPNLDELDNEALKSRLRTVQSQYDLLSNELSSMEAAWRKSSALASKKVEDVAQQEETVARLNAEKAKADQKYFAAMKLKDSKEAELRAAKSANARSTEIITQLKDTEAKTRELITNSERQLAEAKEGLLKLESQHRTLEAKSKESALSADGLKKQLDELKTMISAKDKEVLTAGKAKREAEVELEKIQSKLEDTKKQFEQLKKSRAADNAASDSDWRRLAICPVCNQNIRNTALKLCGHVFCNNCIKDLITNRSRKCPSCAKAFGNSDYLSIVLT
ncbi:BRE1-domain-containing protein [Teratosphaeria nubilosa]|uniref:E3 ubiquitin protein ligase n=1 Tax=Teratosphaeria nubilosa TaxID=161662 RepID=A0A6G1L1A4_9PEZI|nr:BRE1-domain-containing protein [Teratosphaeria nubilosa]